jgi:GrpB-like predicted nucleotidyltransferase (UPF0157 family)
MKGLVMSKALSGMTNEKLWQLFPIVLSEHKPIWRVKYLEEKVWLENVVGKENIDRMNHYGSTSVPNLIAKPTIDILLEIKGNCDLEILIKAMTSKGYIYCEQPNNPAPHMMFMKGYTLQGFQGQAFHVHVRYSGDWDELYFRDYLIEHPEIADEYGELKIELFKVYEHDRDRYTQAKTDFIKMVTKLAREQIDRDNGSLQR